MILAPVLLCVTACDQVGRPLGVIGQDVLDEHRASIAVAGPMLDLMEDDRDPALVPAERCHDQPKISDPPSAQ